MKISLLAAAVAISLSGCAGIQQAARGYGSAAIASIRAAEDDNIALWTINACGTPLSAAIRHPQIIPALRALCLPGWSSSNPTGLLQEPDKM